MMHGLYLIHSGWDSYHEHTERMKPKVLKSSCCQGCLSFTVHVCLLLCGD